MIRLIRRARLGVRTAALLPLLLVPSLAVAWGAEGHRLIAELAFDRLPIATRERVQALLALEPGATLPSIATWADEVRSPTTAAWHYTNFDRESGCRYDAEKDCSDGQCVVGALERQTHALSNAKTPVIAQRIAIAADRLAGVLTKALP